MIDDTLLVDDYLTTITDRMEIVIQEATGMAAEDVSMGSSDLMNPPMDWKVNILPMLDGNDIVRGSSGTDQFGDPFKAPDKNTITGGVQIEVYRRGEDLKKAIRIAATIRASLETDQELAKLVDLIHYAGRIPLSSGGEQKVFVLVALVMQFRYSTASGEPWRRIQ